MPITDTTTRRSARPRLVLSLMLVVALIPSLVACTVPTATSTTIAKQTPESEKGTNGACGRERWAVKTMSDSEAKQVDLTPITTTVQDLTQLRAPKSLPENGRVVPTELSTYRVTARLLEAKIEDDEDIHLVIADAKNAKITMIVELPNPTCPGADSSRVVQQMSTVRQEFVGKFGSPPTSHFEKISGTAQITGVAFFDFLHGQTGVAPNGVELHPVIEFRLLGGG